MLALQITSAEPHCILLPTIVNAQFNWKHQQTTNLILKHAILSIVLSLAFLGNDKLAELLIKNGADVNITKKGGLSTPLHMAALNGSILKKFAEAKWLF